MPATSSGTASASPGLSAAERWGLVSIALVFGIIGRLIYSWNAPFWFDEQFSGTIATQPTVAKLVAWCLAELTGPAFYMPLWLWEKVAGSSNFALRLPGLVLSLAIPVLILWRGHPNRDIRFFWGLLCLLWVPAFAVAGEARPYPQMFALGAAQAMLFLRVIERPSIGRAAGWIAVGVTLVLTHYWAVVPFFVQGIAYLAVHRRRAVATWPALLLLIPLIAWGSIHLPGVLRFTVGSVQAHDGLPLSSLAEIPAMILGIGFNGSIILGTMLVTVLMAARRGQLRLAAPTPDLILAMCGIASVAVSLWLGFTRPGFIPRHMTAAIPSFLFAMALWARWMLARDKKPVILVLGMSLLTAAGVVLSIVTAGERDPRHSFNLEESSAWIGARHPSNLIVFWDGPVGSVSDSSRIADVAGFFFRRSGQSVTVQVARAQSEDDPNANIIALLRARPGGSVVWFANDELPRARAPRLAGKVPGLECHDFGRDVVIMTACRPEG